MQSIAYVAGGAVGPWRLLAPVERTETEEVWRADRNAGAQCVRLTVLPAHAAADRRSAGAFRSDAAAAPHLGHPAILRLLDAGHDVPPWLAFEWVDAIDLRRLGPCLAAMTDRSAAVAIIGHVIERALAALVHAHGAAAVPGGIVHRRLDPAKILVTTEGAVKVTGFGVAGRPQDEASGIQSPDLLRYVAPEQAGNDARAAKVDVFALGAILHELLDGRRFRDEHDDAVSLYRVAIAGKVTPLRDAVDPAIEALRNAMLAAAPARANAASALAMTTRWPGLAHGESLLARLVQHELAPPTSASTDESMLAAAARVIDHAPMPAAAPAPAFAPMPAAAPAPAPAFAPMPAAAPAPAFAPMPAAAPAPAFAPMPAAMPMPAAAPAPAFAPMPAAMPMPAAAPAPAFAPMPAAMPSARPMPSSAEDEGTVELDQAVLAAMRAGQPIPTRPVAPAPVAPAPVAPARAPAPRELVVPPPGASPSARAAEPPRPSAWPAAAAPSPAAAAPSPAAAAPSPAPEHAAAPAALLDAQGRLDLQPTIEPTTTTTIRTRRRSRNLLVVLIVAGVLAIVIGATVGYMLVDGDPPPANKPAAPTSRPR
jgi:hypothetical protein